MHIIPLSQAALAEPPRSPGRSLHDELQHTGEWYGEEEESEVGSAWNPREDESECCYMMSLHRPVA